MHVNAFEPNIRPDCTEELTAALGQRIMVIDGAMGTAIQRDRPDEAGYRGERFIEWPTALQGNNDLLNLTQPQIIEGIHREYLEAGADILETNTFNANAVSLSDYGMEELAYELNYESARLALRLQTLQEDERRQIAEALHDSTAQHVVGIGLLMGMIERRVALTDESRALLENVRDHFRGRYTNGQSICSACLSRLIICASSWR